MKKAFFAKTEAGPDELFEVVGDLGTYPHWLDVVETAEESGEPATWIVTLRARVGPFARSKRLRMVRTVHEDMTVRFERRETDGKNHSDWTMAATVTAVDALPVRSEVSLDLIYAGAMWSGLLDGVLGAAAERATERLQDYVQA